MDELDEEETGEDVDVAALMGFGSFGDQHRGKRRRHHARTEEAVVDGSIPGLETGKGRGNKSSGSGSNNLPLGTGRPRPKKSGALETEGNGKSGNAESPTHFASPSNEPAPPSPDKLAPTPTHTPAPTQSPRTTSGADTSLPPKPPLPSLSHSSGKVPPTTTPGTRIGIGTGIGTGTRTENEAWKLRKGVRLANGDVAYYDASFVEDPWRGLR